MERSGVTPNVVTFNSVINACAQCGDVDRAESWFRRMLAKEVTPSVETFNSLINACAKAGDALRAEEWFEEISSHGLEPDAFSYSTLSHARAATRNTPTQHRGLRAGATGASVDATCYNT